ncbi:hypothetical protein BDR07DRAFT_1415442 [Suillus spraguei]|nr:hypothetical protein BDR07DRAFT_1415442 [Suillus spraguei]
MTTHRKDIVCDPWNLTGIVLQNMHTKDEMNFTEATGVLCLAFLPCREPFISLCLPPHAAVCKKFRMTNLCHLPLLPMRRCVPSLPNVKLTIPLNPRMAV